MTIILIGSLLMVNHKYKVIIHKLFHTVLQYFPDFSTASDIRKKFFQNVINTLWKNEGFEKKVNIPVTRPQNAPLRRLKKGAQCYL